MKRPTAASLKKVTAENLARLGPERLAEILMTAAETKPELKRWLRMELAADQGAEHLLPEIDKRLAALSTSRSRIGWRQRPTFIRDLDSLRGLIAGRLLPLDRRAALDRLWLFMGLSRKVAHRLYDRHDHLAEVFHRAAEDLRAALTGAEPEQAGAALAEALAADPHGWSDWLAVALEGAEPALAAAALRNISQRSNATGAWLPLIRRLADAAHDPDAFAATFTPAARKDPSVAAEIGQRLLAAERVEEAGDVLRAGAKARKGSIFGRPNDEVDFDWESVWIDYLDRSGDAAGAQAARWASFERMLSPDRLRAFVSRLADFDDVEAEQKAFAHAAAHKSFAEALAFLMAWPARAEAAGLIEARAEEIDLPADDAERWAAELEGRHPKAAHLLLRKAATAAFRRRDFKTCDRLTEAADAIDA